MDKLTNFYLWNVIITMTITNSIIYQIIFDNQKTKVLKELFLWHILLLEGIFFEIDFFDTSFYLGKLFSFV
jgi:hypothetical protein